MTDFHGLLKKKNHHINGAVTLRAVERGVDDTSRVCDVSHKTVLVAAIVYVSGGAVYLLRQNVARTALASKAL